MSRPSNAVHDKRLLDANRIEIEHPEWCNFSEDFLNSKHAAHKVFRESIILALVKEGYDGQSIYIATGIPIFTIKKCLTEFAALCTQEALRLLNQSLNP